MSAPGHEDAPRSRASGGRRGRGRHGRSRPPQRGWRGSVPPGAGMVSTRELVRVVLDHGIRQQFLAHALDLDLGFGLVRLDEIDLDVLALAYVADAGEAKRGES